MDVKEALSKGSDGRHPWEAARLRVVSDLLRRRLPDFGAEGDALLDVGCGDGYVMGELARSHPLARFVGVDSALSPDLLEKINAQNRNVRASARMETLPKKIRAALLLDVLEHLEDDSGSLRGIAEKPELARAEFFITVPAFTRLFSHHDRFLGHFRRYSLAQLKETASTAGLAVLHGGYFFFSLLPFRMWRAFVDSKAPFDPAKTRGVAGWKGRGLFDAVIASLLYADYKAGLFLNKLGFAPPGLSCFVVCKRP